MASWLKHRDDNRRLESPPPPFPGYYLRCTVYAVYGVRYTVYGIALVAYTHAGQFGGVFVNDFEMGKMFLSSLSGSQPVEWQWVGVEYPEGLFTRWFT